MSLLNKINAIGAKANDLTGFTLNRGGCCVFASLLADALAEVGVEAKGVVASFVGDDVDRQRPENPYKARNWDKNGVNLSHVGLEFKIDDRAYFFDSMGAFRSDTSILEPSLGNLPILPGRLSRGELRALAADSGYWNASFDRDYIPALAVMVREELGLEPKPEDVQALAQQRQQAEEDEKLLEMLAA